MPNPDRGLNNHYTLKESYHTAHPPTEITECLGLRPSLVWIRDGLVALLRSTLLRSKLIFVVELLGTYLSYLSHSSNIYLGVHEADVEVEMTTPSDRPARSRIPSQTRVTEIIG